MFLQRRIGAFEVQIKNQIDAAHSNYTILYSKLKSKNWPNLEKLVNEIPKYLKKINVLLQLKFKEDKKPLNEASSKLKGIEVELVPIRKELGLQRLVLSRERRAKS